MREPAGLVSKEGAGQRTDPRSCWVNHARCPPHDSGGTKRNVHGLVSDVGRPGTRQIPSPKFEASLEATRPKTKTLAEKRHHMILESVCHSACMSTRIDFEGIYDSVFIKSVVEFARVDS